MRTVIMILVGCAVWSAQAYADQFQVISVYGHYDPGKGEGADSSARYGAFVINETNGSLYTCSVKVKIQGFLHVPDFPLCDKARVLSGLMPPGSISLFYGSPQKLPSPFPALWKASLRNGQPEITFCAADQPNVGSSSKPEDDEALDWHCSNMPFGN
jgi:hypothetical protein